MCVCVVVYVCAFVCILLIWELPQSGEHLIYVCVCFYLCVCVYSYAFVCVCMQCCPDIYTTMGQTIHVLPMYVFIKCIHMYINTHNMCVCA